MAQHDINSNVGYAGFEKPKQIFRPKYFNFQRNSPECTLNDIIQRKCKFKASVPTMLSQNGQPIRKPLYDF